jgi:hypothetical protein
VETLRNPTARPTVHSTPLQPNPKDAKQDFAAKAASVRPTEDQLYLAGRLNDAWECRGELTPAAVCKLNKLHGIVPVCDALRLVRGFPPPAPGASLYAYISAILRGDSGPAWDGGAA